MLWCTTKIVQATISRVGINLLIAEIVNAEEFNLS